MAQRMIRCGVVGAREKDLFALGELHKRPGIEILFVFDRDPAAVGLEIAEILGIARVADASVLSTLPAVDYVVVTEPRGPYESQLRELAGRGARILGQVEAMDVLCGGVLPTSDAPDPPDEDEEYSIDDALTGFERLFDRKQLLKFLLDVAVRAAKASAGSIMIFSPEANELYIAYATGLSERVVRNTRQKLGEGIAGTVARERKGKLIRSVKPEGLYASERDRVEISSAISVPLIWHDKLIGVLNVSTRNEKDKLTEDGLRALEKLGTRISRVLFESSRLQETQVRNRELTLRQSVGKLSEKSMQPQTKFSMLANLLADMIGAETVEIFIGTNEGEWLVLGGSNRRVATHPDMIRCDRGAVSRAYLDRTTVVLTESPYDGDAATTVSSFAFVPLHLSETLGVLMLEFSDRSRLEDFLVIKESVTLELSRFIASERRERRLRRELYALGKVSDAAPSLLTCRSIEDLCDLVSRVVADALECERVSVRIQPQEEGQGRLARFEGPAVRLHGWAEEDDERFLKLRKKKEKFTLAFLNFGGENDGRVSACHSLLALPVKIENRFAGGIIAYDKRPTTALEEATFTDIDAAVIEQIISIAVPVVRGLIRSGEAAVGGEPSYDAVLAGNAQRVRRVLESEMARADRYHQAFSLMVIRVESMEAMFEKDFAGALALVDEITRGIQTRTRKTDYGTWIRRDTFAMVSLEGTRRIRFLLSRLMMYLLKDFSAGAAVVLDPADVLIGHAVYPGASRAPDAMLAEVEATLAPYGQQSSN